MENDIKNKLYEIRGVQVMLDSSLAFLYQCSNGTKTINQAVKRYINRFPKEFMFQLTKEEYLTYVFTEEGVAMLMTMIKGRLVIEQNI